MATIAKKTISLTVDGELYDQLEKLKKTKKNTSLSSIVLELTKSGLELKEDLYFAQLAEERRKEPVISHKKIWNEK